MIADVFDESPGDEIVAGLTHYTGSPMAIRVYDFGGHILWESWHDGTISHMYWMRGPRLLVCDGLHNAHRWTDLGVTGVEYFYPRVVFAVQPRMGMRGEWIDTSPSGAAWYKFVQPFEANDWLTDTQLWKPELEEFGADRVEMLLNLAGPQGGGRGSVVLLINAQGEVVGQRPSDHFKAAFGAGWDKTFGLVDMPRGSP